MARSIPTENYGWAYIVAAVATGATAVGLATLEVAEADLWWLVAVAGGMIFGLATLWERRRHGRADTSS